MNVHEADAQAWSTAARKTGSTNDTKQPDYENLTPGRVE